MTDRDPRILEDEARELWRRAAELQAAAEQARSEHAVSVQDTSALSLEQVSAAAEGAGIDPDYVRIALAERRLPDINDIDRTKIPVLRRLLDYEVEAVEVSRWIPATAERAVAAVREVAPSDTYGLTLESTLGKDPSVDGVMVYRINDAKTNSTFHSDTNWADMRVLLITVRPEADGSRIRIRAPLFRRNTNVAITGSFAAFNGFWGFKVGGGIGGSLAALLGVSSAAAVLGPAVAGALVGGGIGVGAYRYIYKWVTRGGESALNRLLQSIAMKAE